MRLTPRTMIRRQHSRRRAGLSLLEVLLSLAILVISLAAIGQLVDMGMNNGLQTKMNNAAARLAQSKLAEVEAGITSFDSTSGSFNDTDSDWQWSMSAQTQGTNLYTVTVTVSRELKGVNYSYSVSQLILDPTTLGSAAAAARPDPDAASDPSTTTGTTGTTGGSP